MINHSRLLTPDRKFYAKIVVVALLCGALLLLTHGEGGDSCRSKSAATMPVTYTSTHDNSTAWVGANTIESKGLIRLRQNRSPVT